MPRVAWLLVFVMAGTLWGQVPESRRTNRRYGGSLSFGSSLKWTADIDGDGYLEMLVTASRAGGSLGFGEIGVLSGKDGTPIWSAVGLFDGSRLGTDAILWADLNGDGVQEVATVSESNFVGGSISGVELRVFNGASGQVIGNLTLPGEFGDGDLKLLGVGDRNGDNVPEVVIGCVRSILSPMPRLLVVDLVSGSVVATIPLLGAYASTTNTFTYGVTLLGGRDRNGDGTAEIVVGYPRWSNGGIEIFDGANFQPLLFSEGPVAGLNFGASLAWVDDRNGDGTADLVVGAPGVWAGPGLSFPTPSGLVLIVDGLNGDLLQIVSAPVGAAGFGTSVHVVPTLFPRLVIGCYVEPLIAPGPTAIAAVEMRTTGQPGPTWTPRRLFEVDASTAPRGVTHLVEGDWNQDGHSDYLVATSGLAGFTVAPGEVHLFPTPAGTHLGPGPMAVHRLQLGVISPLSDPLSLSIGLQPGPPALPYALVVGTAPDDRPFHGGRLRVDLSLPFVTLPGVLLNGFGVIALGTVPPELMGTELYIQAGALSPLGPLGVILSDGWRLTL